MITSLRISLLLLACGLSGLLHAQFESAEVLGTVRDATAKAVPNAAVTLTNQDTGIQSKATTDESGNYDFFNVKIGRYTLTVEHPGFSKFTTTDVVVNVNARQRVDASLQLGAVSESIEVTGAASALETDSSQRGQVVNMEAIKELPLNGRSFSDLALLTTNVHNRFMRTPFPRVKAHSTLTECAALITTSFWTAWTTMPTRPAIRDIPTRWRSPRRMPSPNLK